jgi:endonuclease YncB( thermonuclease family)
LRRFGGDIAKLGAELLHQLLRAFRESPIAAAPTAEAADGEAIGQAPVSAPAAAELRSLIGDRAVACERRDTDRHGRMVAVCWAGAVELNREMVRAGWAIAYRHFSAIYVDDEAEARAAHRGICKGAFQDPWHWRQEHPRRSQRTRLSRLYAPVRAQLLGNLMGSPRQI